MNVRAAAFLDRDGVLIADQGLVTRPEQLVVCDGVVPALICLRELGLAVVVVTNQPVIARGLASEAEVIRLHEILRATLAAQGALIERFYFCPHHPNADLAQYRVACACRKPRPGMLRQAAQDLHLDLEHSFMIGDRPSDVLAGKRAGCKAILVCSGQHTAPPIQTPDAPEAAEPDFVADSLQQAVRFVNEARQ